MTLAYTMAFDTVVTGVCLFVVGGGGGGMTAKELRT